MSTSNLNNTNDSPVESSTNSPAASPLLEEKLSELLVSYEDQFVVKDHSGEDSSSDILMEAFGISPEMKEANSQYWGRALGMLFQSLVVETVSNQVPHKFKPAKRYEDGSEPYDLRINRFAVDTKYRIGSGDSGTQRKLRDYGLRLTEEGLQPVALILRDDSLPAALGALVAGNWKVISGSAAFDWLADRTNGYRLDKYLISQKGKFRSA